MIREQQLRIAPITALDTIWYYACMPMVSEQVWGEMREQIYQQIDPNWVGAMHMWVQLKIVFG